MWGGGCAGPLRPPCRRVLPARASRVLRVARARADGSSSRHHARTLPSGVSSRRAWAAGPRHAIRSAPLPFARPPLCPPRATLCRLQSPLCCRCVPCIHAAPPAAACVASPRRTRGASAASFAPPPLVTDLQQLYGLVNNHLQSSLEYPRHGFLRCCHGRPRATRRSCRAATRRTDCVYYSI